MISLEPAPGNALNSSGGSDLNFKRGIATSFLIEIAWASGFGIGV